MNFIGARVEHKTFGTGYISEQSASQISIQFEKLDVIKKFIYPTAFKCFLTFCDSELQTYVDGVLHSIEEQELEEKRQREAEAEALRKERELELLEKKREAAKKRASTKKAAAKKAPKNS